MSIECALKIHGEEHFARVLEDLKNYNLNLACSVYDGWLRVKYTGKRTTAQKIVKYFEQQKEHEVTILSYRAWKSEN